MYYGRMTSTQRLKSQNTVLKDGYVTDSTSLHMFAKRMLDSLQYTDHMDAEPGTDPEVKNAYLVKHKKGIGNFRWAKHPFKVIANKEAGVYECECKQWEHTGLFCMHIIKAFTHLQVQTIPEKYILRRYTRDARSDVPWDRHDVVHVGHQGNTDQS